MSLASMVLFSLIVFLAAIVQGISGFAFIMIVLIIFPYLFGYTEAIALASFIYLFVLYSNSFLYRKHIEWKFVPLWVVTCILADSIGVIVLRLLGDSPIWYILMGIIFVLIAFYLLFVQRKIRITPNTKNLILFATLCGGINGFFAVGGPIMATYFLTATPKKETYLGTTQILGVFTITIDVIMRALSGMYTVDSIKIGILGIVIAIFGLFIAKKLVSKMNEAHLHRIVCIVIFLSGIKMLFF